jgi:alkanesulfonate monooxygenase SsuD/methylene tetrahydromethanopterin reductase-like flavin-dependent oxidoreductase (luciferase family)
MLEVGIALRTLVSDSNQPIFDQVEETAKLLRFVGNLGTFDTVRAQHHWLSYPSVWIEPIPLLSRLAPEAGQMRLMTSVMKPPIHNPIDLAHQIATIDHICNGRFIFGVGVGYQREELEAVGATRKERAGRMEEALQLMKALWTGDEISFSGKYWSIKSVRMGYTPLQKPHPPIWSASYSVAATERAARICDGVLIAPQASWSAVKMHADNYRAALAKYGKQNGRVGLNRTVSIATTYEEADKAARAKVAEAALDYGRWGMQESSTVDMVLDPERDPRDWAIVGTPDDCIETISRYKESVGFDFLGPSFANLPKDQTARKEYLQYVSEEVFCKVR